MKRRNGVVYFVKPIGLKGPIKIGYSDKPEERLRNMQGSSPWPLRMIGRVPGTIDDERFLHRCFPHLHSHGEWFRWSADLDAAIEAILGSGLSHAYATLTPTGQDQPWARKKRSPEVRQRQSISLRLAWNNRRRRANERAAALQKRAAQ